MDFKAHIAARVKAGELTQEEIYNMIALPPNTEMGDFALPCFRLAKTMRKSPAIIAQEIAESYPKDEIVSDVSALNGYVNFKIDRVFWTKQTLERILSEGDRYGSSDEGKGKTVCIDYSSVNIAKPFHIGHLSTTVLGSALYKLHKFLGYTPVGINHLGDYGTQFGKLISAYKRWGKKEDVEKGGLRALNALYVRFHEEAEKDPSLNDEARSFFKKIEDKDEESVALFNWFKELTLKDVGRIYELLDVHFDSWAGESFYNDKMQPVVDELREKGLLKESEGAQIVDLEAYGMPPCIILRSDGASLYATRDIAAAIYRKKTYDFYKCLYVVAYQQNLHFKQFFKVLELMGKEWAKDLVHVAYGMVSLEDGSMSTRKGKVVYLEDVIQKCVQKAHDIIAEKNPSLENKEEIARTVGVGAVIFGALYNNKIKDITFSYDKVLNFEGETSCYVQYTCARANSVLDKGGRGGTYSVGEVVPQEFELVKKLADFPSTLHDALEKYEPCFVARYAVDLSQLFNKFYFDCSILNAGDENTRNFRLALTQATLVTLTNALRLLGIGVPEKDVIMVKAVIFDLDGTLLNTLPDLNACMNEALVKFGCPTITTEQTRQYVGHGGLRYAQAALPENKRAQAEYFYKTIYCPILFACKNQLTKPFDGESECMDALRAAGIKLAVVTNKSQEAATELGNTLLAPYGFDVIFGNRDGIPVKPDPASTLMVLKELGVSAQEAVFVGDGDTDVQTARNAGMRCVSVLWGYRSREQLIGAGANLFAENFLQLRDILLSM